MTGCNAMRRWHRGVLAVLIGLLAQTSNADDLWLQVAQSSGAADGYRVAASRSLANFGLDGLIVGATHQTAGESSWSTLDMNFVARPDPKLVLAAHMRVGPAEFNGVEQTYQNYYVGATMTVRDKWYITAEDTYIDIDQTRGHILGASAATVTEGGWLWRLSALQSVGSDIETRSLQLNFDGQAPVSFLGGISAGISDNSELLSQFEQPQSAGAVDVINVYAGFRVPMGRASLLSVADLVRVDDSDRLELSLTVKFPL